MQFLVAENGAVIGIIVTDGILGVRFFAYAKFTASQEEKCVGCGLRELKGKGKTEIVKYGREGVVHR